MSTRYCRDCGTLIPAARLVAVPNADRCVPCLTAAGDVPMPMGCMVYEHKTAPTILIVDQKAMDNINRWDRKHV